MGFFASSGLCQQRCIPPLHRTQEWGTLCQIMNRKNNGTGAGPFGKYEGRLFSRPWHRAKSDSYFLAGGAIASLVAFATRNFTTVLALIWMGSPVCGLRPMRALR
jgi:hypothetical protein